MPHVPIDNVLDGRNRTVIMEPDVCGAEISYSSDVDRNRYAETLWHTCVLDCDGRICVQWSCANHHKDVLMLLEFTIANPTVAVLAPEWAPTVLNDPAFVGVIVSDEHNTVIRLREFIGRPDRFIDAAGVVKEILCYIEHNDHWTIVLQDPLVALGPVAYRNADFLACPCPLLPVGAGVVARDAVICPVPETILIRNASVPDIFQRRIYPAAFLAIPASAAGEDVLLRRIKVDRGIACVDVDLRLKRTGRTEYPAASAQTLFLYRGHPVLSTHISPVECAVRDLAIHGRGQHHRISRKRTDLCAT